MSCQTSIAKDSSLTASGSCVRARKMIESRENPKPKKVKIPQAVRDRFNPWNELLRLVISFTDRPYVLKNEYTATKLS